MDKPKEVVFAEGCFDDFDGTQEELDEMIAYIKEMAESGELFEQATEIDVDSLPEDEREALIRAFDSVDNSNTDQPRRRLH